MAAVQRPPSFAPSVPASMAQRSNAVAPAGTVSMPRRCVTDDLASSITRRHTPGAFLPVNQNGSYEFDRMIKTGYVQKRIQRTKLSQMWKSMFLVLRPNVLSIYKSDKEEKLRYKIYLSELTAATLLNSPKQKRLHVFGLFSSAKNFLFRASTAQEAGEWVEVLRREARIDEEEEKLLSGPIPRPVSYAGAGPIPVTFRGLGDRHLSISDAPNMAEYSGFSGLSANEVASHSDLSDYESPPPVTMFQPLAPHHLGNTDADGVDDGARNADSPPGAGAVRNGGHSVLENCADRIIWQGWLSFLRSRRSVRHWKDHWAVLRPRNLIIYKDESEYTAQFILPLYSILNVVDIDPVSRNKLHCLQIITDEKTYKFCADGEEPLVQCLGAFKSILAKRKDLETKAKAAAASATNHERPRT